jgi:hypothetical protein
MCGCWCDDEVEDEDLDEVLREIEEEAIDVTEEFAIPVRIDEEVEADR